MHTTTTTSQITHNRWEVSPQVKEDLRVYTALLVSDTEKYLVQNPVTPSNHFEVVGKLCKELRDIERAMDEGHAYKFSFEHHDFNVKSIALKILTKNFLSIAL